MCGILGFSGNSDIVNVGGCVKSLNTLTNRGKDSTGIVVKDSLGFFSKKTFGIMNEEVKFESLENEESENLLMLGHCRYSTYGEVDNDDNIHPHSFKDVHLVHNGNIPEIEKYKNKLVNPFLLKGNSDSEILLHRIVQNSEKMGLKMAVQQVVEEVKGAFSAIIMDDKNMMAFRDKWGIRPLYFGVLKGKSFGFASETKALEKFGARYIGEVRPGEILSIGIDNNILESFIVTNREQQKFCPLEIVYLMAKDGKYEEKFLYEYRKELGANLAKEFPDLKADFVIGIPNSGLPAAQEFAYEKKIPYLQELVINPKYQNDRSFILPEGERKKVASNKFLREGNDLKGKKVIIVDDSVIRGTITSGVCEILKKAGVDEIHVCSSLPSVTNTCDLGIFLPNKNELLLGNNPDCSVAANKIGATSINFLSLNALNKVLGTEICTGCLGGEYPF